MRTLTCLLLLASLAAAADTTYSIQLHRPATVGQKWQVILESQLSSRAVMKVGADSTPLPGVDLTLNVTGLVEVLEVDKSGREQKLRFTNDVGFIVVNGQKSEEFAKGMVIIVTAGKGGSTFAAEKGELSDLAKAVLPMAFLLKAGDSPTDDVMLGTKERVKPGDLWKVNPEAIAKDVEAAGSKAAAADISGQVKLERVEKVDDVECLRLSCRIDVARFLPPDQQGGSLPPGFKLESGRIEAQVRGLLPVDSTKSRIFDAEQSTITTIARGRQGNADATLETTLKRTREATYRPK